MESKLVLQELFAMCKAPPPQVVWDRFWSKVQNARSWRRCWIWARGKDRKGYGKFCLGRHGKRASRWIMLWLHGDIGELVADHVWCNNHGCVNPYHLAPNTNHGNLFRAGTKHNARKTHCKRGHEFGENDVQTTQTGRKWRRCQVCYEVLLKKSRESARD